MTGMENAIEQAAEVIAQALNGPADACSFGSYTDVKDLSDATLDGRYSLMEAARALAEAGLLAPQRREWAIRLVGPWMPVDRAEGDGRADQ